MAKKRSAKKKVSGTKKSVETITHADDKRTNIPTAELESVVSAEDKTPKKVKYPRNTDLDPQLVWRGKDEQDWSDLVVNAPPLYIQEKVHPKVLIDDLLRQTQQQAQKGTAQQLDLFADFNGLPDSDAKTEFYQHEANWTNRMILGDSLQVMASLAEREGLRGKVQCIYLDPPYGIKFNSNFQWSTTSRDVKDGKSDHITREPEQVKAFRDTWRDGIHSYLTYLRDRLTVARDLLSESGSIFVQIGDENVHRVRTLMDEVFGDEQCIALISVTKTTSSTNEFLSGVADYVLWFSKHRDHCKYRQMYRIKEAGGSGAGHYNAVVQVDGTRRPATSAERRGEVPRGATLYTADQLQSASMGREKGEGAASWFSVECEGRAFTPTMQSRWKTNEIGMKRLHFAGRLIPQKNALRYLRKIDDFAAFSISNMWTDMGGATDKRYVVESSPRLVERCLLMASDPGDLVIDPTCGSGTTAYVAEQWGRRWITIDTSRVAFALTRARIIGARYPYFLLKDSCDGAVKEADIARSIHSETRAHNHNIRHGFVYERVARIMLSSIAHNAEIDVIWEQFQEKLEPLRDSLNTALGQTWEEWEIPRDLGDDIRVHSRSFAVQKQETANGREFTRIEKQVRKLHAEWWELRIARQKEIDASIAAKADFEYLYDRPYEDKSKVRVAGPFTVESLSPHRILGVDENDELIDPQNPKPKRQRGKTATTSQNASVSQVAEIRDDYNHALDDFVSVILQNLKTSGVQQSAKDDKINFTSITGWPGDYICAKAQYVEGETEESGDEKTAGIFIGPEFGTVSRQDLVRAVRECADAGFHVLIACAFNYEAHASEFNKLGNIPVLKARMNADLHMAEDLKNTGAGNLFVIFGEPDIEIRDAKGEGTLGQVVVQIKGVDVFKPQTGEVQSDSTDGIACWFIDTDYNEESFFVRHAYFLGAGDPYKSLKTTLKAEINEDAWESLNSDTSRPFNKPNSGCIAVKVINHLGDEVMKVFRVE